jgi:hypothetical protein
MATTTNIERVRVSTNTYACGCDVQPGQERCRVHGASKVADLLSATHTARMQCAVIMASNAIPVGGDPQSVDDWFAHVDALMEVRT